MVRPRYYDHGTEQRGARQVLRPTWPLIVPRKSTLSVVERGCYSRWRSACRPSYARRQRSVLRRPSWQQGFDDEMMSCRIAATALIHQKEPAEGQAYSPRLMTADLRSGLVRAIAALVALAGLVGCQDG